MMIGKSLIKYYKVMVLAIDSVYLISSKYMRRVRGFVRQYTLIPCKKAEHVLRR
jgi:hypothetical protein